MVTGPVEPLTATGERVWVATVDAADIPAYRLAVTASRARIGEWNPVNPDDLQWHLSRQSLDHRTFLVHAKDPAGSHGIVGKVNVTNVVRGRFQNGVIGYDAYDPYAGRGLFAEGLRLIVGLCFAEAPHGMGLHRIEANVRPGNAASSGMLRSLGFRREGHVRDMLWLQGRDGVAWRDHDAHAVTREEWPAAAYAAHRPLRMTVLVNGLPGSGSGDTAARLASELSVPVFSRSAMAAAIAAGFTATTTHELTDPGATLATGTGAALWQLLAGSATGGVVEAHVPAGDEVAVHHGFRAAGFDPTRVPQVWCDLPVADARRRHESADGQMWDESVWRRLGLWQPLPLGDLIRVDATRDVTDREIVAAGLRVRAAHT
ncbi:ribosomal-protein-alanine N-acetyltransferase [Rudaeicoccus suwonensis]|uniref:Ribosomal-protein-alanine N-acetyltransferase n=1 Tax=Rudaeicoccus suwonensis TaxID=657409 RepID=A0A561EC08_9MICO|nr:ribosomal-protein-alanine N-acetyltransferase [Rudaeicoccus suwonensis]